MKKNIFLFVFTLLSTLTASAYDAQIDGIYYNFSGTEATVTSGRYGGYTGSVMIPATVTYDGVTYSVTSIENSTFAECSSLTSVTIPNSVTKIGDHVFQFCAALISVTIPNSVTSIGMYAFSDCSALTSITIPNSVMSIGEYVFAGCSGLKEVTIPSSVTSISSGTFSLCKGLTSVTCEATSVPSTGQYVFYEVPQSSATLYVPASALEDYKATSPWSEFGTIVAIDEYKPVAEGIAINETNFPDEIFRNWILSQEYGQDGVLTEEEIASVTVMRVDPGIQNMQGIEFFTALKILELPSGILTSLDVSKNTALEELMCRENMLTSLDLSQNKALTSLNCFGNAIESLDVSNNTALKTLVCSYNQLTSLIVSKNSALQYLDCNHNQLTSLDVSNKTELSILWCYNNQLTSLDVSGCANLMNISFYCNQLKGAAMDKLVEGLPTYDFENRMGVIYFENEGNEMTTTQVAVAKAKNMIPYYAINEDEWQEYEGSEPEVKKCATPSISYEGGILTFSCETEGVEYIYNMTPATAISGSGNNISAPTEYKVSVYATKSGYENSDVATMDITVGGGSTAMKGDVNEDGTVNGTDIQEVINIIVNAE